MTPFPSFHGHDGPPQEVPCSSAWSAAQYSFAGRHPASLHSRTPGNVHPCPRISALFNSSVRSSALPALVALRLIKPGRCRTVTFPQQSQFFFCTATPLSNFCPNFSAIAPSSRKIFAHTCLDSWHSHILCANPRTAAQPTVCLVISSQGRGSSIACCLSVHFFFLP